MTSIFDRRATPLVNETADQAWNMITQLQKEAPGEPIDMRRICLWSAQAVAPRDGEAAQRGLAYEASIVIQQALALDRMVMAVRGRAA